MSDDAVTPRPTTPQATRRRRVAEQLVRHAARVTPFELRRWADAMRNEITYIADDRQALWWSAGCVRAAHVARLRTLYLLDLAVVRTVAVLLISLRAFDAMFPTVLTTAYRMRAAGTTDVLGLVTAGDDYHRLVPLMEAIPLWLHLIATAAGACYLVALWGVLKRRRAAGPVLLIGVGAEAAATLLARPIVADIGVQALPNPSVFATIVLPVIVPVIMAAAAWSGSRRERLRVALCGLIVAGLAGASAGSSHVGPPGAASGSTEQATRSRSTSVAFCSSYGLSGGVPPRHRSPVTNG